MTPIALTAILTALLPLGVALYVRTRLDPGLKFIVLDLAFGIVFDFLTISLRHLDFAHLWAMHFFTLLEFTLHSLAFFFWAASDGKKKTIKLAAILFGLIWLVSKFTIEDMNKWDSYTAPLAYLWLTILAAMALLEFIQKNTESAHIHSRFWVLIGVLLYYSVASMLMALGYTALFIKTFQTFPIHSIFRITQHFCFTGAFLCLVSKQN